MSFLLVVVPGKVASNNRVTRFDGRGARKNPEATSYQQRVFQHAFAAVQISGWKMPSACEVLINAYNQRLDIDNIPKSILDGLIGVAYDDDRCVLRLQIVKKNDGGAQCVSILVTPCTPLPSAAEIAKAKRKARKATAA